jgi:hypothetical protein
MITMLATLCHMATVSPGLPAIEFCQEEVVAQRADEPTTDNLTACYLAAQPMIAQRLLPGYTLHGVRCAGDRDGKDKPRNAI